jgi:hypothetical protein
MRLPFHAALALVILVPATLAGFVTPAFAEWQVVRVSGAATAARAGAAPVSLAGGAAVPDDVTIETGSNGRVMLSRGTSRILVSPRSSLSLEGGRFGATTVLQRVGQVAFEVEKRDVKHFSVETPSMVAAVKGTRFSVSVAGGTTDVGVSGGLVGVTDLSTGQSADVAPGQRASTRGHGLTVSGRGRKPAITLGQPRPARVDALSREAVSASVGSVAASSWAPADSPNGDDGSGGSNPGRGSANTGTGEGRGSDRGGSDGGSGAGSGNSGQGGGGGKGGRGGR